MNTTEFFVKPYAPKDKHNFGLEKEENGGRSKAPGCYDVFQCKLNERSNRWMTGIDEYAPDVISLSAEDKSKKQAELIAKREEFEILLGLAPGTLKADNAAYWSEFWIKLGEGIKYSPDSAKDRLIMTVAKASGYVPFSYEEAMNPELGEVRFYIEEKHEHVKRDAVNKRKIDKAKSKLIDIEDDFARQFNLAKYLRLPGVDKDMPKDNLYDVISTYIDKSVSNAEDFRKAFELGSDEIALSLLVDESIRFGVIRVKEGKYQRGNITYGLDRDETIEYFKKLENSGEVKSVKKEVENKRKFGNG